jgi:hypothetical protein
VDKIVEGDDESQNEKREEWNDSEDGEGEEGIDWEWDVSSFILSNLIFLIQRNMR